MWITHGGLFSPSLSLWRVTEWPPLSMAMSWCDLMAIKCQIKLMDSNCQSRSHVAQWIIVMEWVKSCRMLTLSVLLLYTFLIQQKDINWYLRVMMSCFIAWLPVPFVAWLPVKIKQLFLYLYMCLKFMWSVHRFNNIINSRIWTKNCDVQYLTTLLCSQWCKVLYYFKVLL